MTQFTPWGLSLAPHKVVLDSDEVKAPGWRAAMRLTGYGYGENLLTVGAAELTASGKRIEYRRAWPLITEWYVNTAAGLEQGFTLAKPPGARLAGESLRLVLKVTGDLIPELGEAGGESVALKQPSGDLALTYSGLRAYDTERQALPVQMKVRGDSIILEVNDEGAVYPVTVDPTFAIQTKVTAGDGAPNDRFGRSVAISGNTAVIGAFYEKVNGNIDQGSVYFFLGNGSTWVQQAQLTAANGAPGDQFGWSVGINGNTIVVGAPNHLLPSGLDRGSAYVFVRTGTSWSQPAN